MSGRPLGIERPRDRPRGEIRFVQSEADGGDVAVAIGRAVVSEGRRGRAVAHRVGRRPQQVRVWKTTSLVAAGLERLVAQNPRQPSRVGVMVEFVHRPRRPFIVVVVKMALPAAPAATGQAGVESCSARLRFLGLEPRDLAGQRLLQRLEPARRHALGDHVCTVGPHSR